MVGIVGKFSQSMTNHRGTESEFRQERILFYNKVDCRPGPAIAELAELKICRSGQFQTKKLFGKSFTIQNKDLRRESAYDTRKLMDHLRQGKNS